jgi:hypothetical protein
MKTSLAACAAVLGIALALQATCAGARADGFDHDYATYAEVLKRHVRYPRVDYAALQAHRTLLDRLVAEFDSTAARSEPGWGRDRRMAFWINAYNAFTLRVVVDHYPIRGSWLSLYPRSSIRQIGGVWTDITWRAAGRTVTLDDIEHRILRPTFRDARIHFAVNCASVSCPPLAVEPYRAATLDEQLDAAARRFLASPEGLRVSGDTLQVSSLFKWYGDDFIAEYAALVSGRRDAGERAVLGAIVRFGPARAAEIARAGKARITYLPYDWSLNDIER